MAGHSKWANIQFRKGAQDKKRGKLFTKLVREITVAARMGGPDAASNPRLRLAIDKALSNSMPKDNIERAVKRGGGLADGDDYEELTYEGYGPSGVAILVAYMTDNRNRTVAEIRHAFSKHNGNLGEDGSVAYLFERRGVLTFAPGADEDAILESALESGADDVVTNPDGSIDVLTSPDAYETVKDALNGASLAPADSDVTMVSSVSVELAGEDAEKLGRLVDALEDLDDVQNVYTNADITLDEVSQD